MGLSSPAYLVFVGLVWLLVRMLPDARPRKICLVAASVLFYLLLDARYLFLLVILGSLTYVLGMAIARGKPAGPCAAIGIATALIVLAFYKFSAVWLPLIPSNPPVGVSGWILPVGISFYSFQAVAYLVDIYRRRLEPVRDWADFSLYMAFFPKIIAGPIVRPTDFFRDLPKGPKPASRTDLPEICTLFLRGLFKKIVIADTLAGLAGVGFQAAELQGGAAFAAPIFWRSFYLFAFQIYADFSGYTDIARASARLLGIPLPENFRFPYFAGSITEFWNRWHMSLTQWFREYFFFPINRALLRSRRGIRVSAVQDATTIATMLLIGLWHGAALPFLGWGLWHGALLSVEKRWNPKPVSPGRKLLAGVMVFHLAGIGWILFRSKTLPGAGRFLAGMIAGGQWFLLPECLLPVVVAWILLVIVDLPGLDSVPRGILTSAFLRGMALTAACILIGAIWLLNWATGGGGLPFLYGMF